MKKTIQVAAALMLLVSAGFAQAKKEKVPPGPLDKKSYTIEITEDGKKKAEPEKDEIKFAAGKFQCTKLFQAEGYKATVYEATYDSSASPITISFTAEAEGEKDVVFKWDGTITEDAIEGTAAILKKGKQKKSYTYSGNIKGKKQPKK